jgi:hypothetical protein
MIDDFRLTIVDLPDLSKLGGINPPHKSND